MGREFRNMAADANVRVLPCGIDPTRFSPSLQRPSNGRLLAVGRLVAQKGYEILIEALALLPAHARPSVDAIGEGPLRAELQEMAHRLGVAGHISFLGERPSQWIAEHGPAYAGFVAPYRIAKDGARDASPQGAKEALAMELPVVASTVTGLKEIVAPCCGRLVPPNDPRALAEAMQWLAGLPEDERRVLGASGRQRAIALFSADGQAATLTDAIMALRPAAIPISA